MFFNKIIEQFFSINVIFYLWCIINNTINFIYDIIKTLFFIKNLFYDSRKFLVQQRNILINKLPIKEI
jgi:hypothetical protein